MTTPLDTGRYGSAEMRGLFTDPARYAAFIRVEGALAEVQGRHGVIPAAAARAVAAQAAAYTPDLAAVARIEEVSRHEVFAVVQEFAARCGEHGRYVHFGATSSDILDTALALQLDATIRLLRQRLTALMTGLSERVGVDGGHEMIGRTHGQHAQPITFGFKLAVFLDQLTRCLERLDELRPRAVMGKMAGAVGTLAGLGPLGPRVQHDVLALLGLPEPRISAQAVARDRVAEFFCWVALTASCLDNLATEIRNLQRTEIGEVAESFAEGDQIGSSAMPHKRNPVRCERVGSLARLLRSLVGPALENVVTWHERDLANSANERFTLPQAGILLDEMLTVMTAVAADLKVRPERMAANLELSRTASISEAVLLALVESGADRLTGYRMVQRASAMAAGGGEARGVEAPGAVGRDAAGRGVPSGGAQVAVGRDVLRALADDPEVTALIPAEELAKFAARPPDTGDSEALTEQTLRHAARALRAGAGAVPGAVAEAAEAAGSDEAENPENRENRENSEEGSR
ncbi:adenylosuccinate lyase [Streptomyces sp. NPDC091279]|uniref:adenylosuccinate lyase n=1 Tax=Streptomyces sp. NPDC091279 TaxID=3365983 RepID=UPI003829F933